MRGEGEEKRRKEGGGEGEKREVGWIEIHGNDRIQQQQNNNNLSLNIKPDR